MAGRRSQAWDQPVVQLRIALADVDPPVWRRLLVPGGVSLGGLHGVFQAAMGWTGSHLHAFEIGDERYGPDDEDAEDEVDEETVSVVDAMADHRRFLYEYDFGDGWEHEVEVEATWAVSTGLKYAVCIDGQQACPPEDCGGPPGYVELLGALGDPSHPEHDDLLEWLGGPFDPSAFDLATANAALQQLR